MREIIVRQIDRNASKQKGNRLSAVPHTCLEDHLFYYFLKKSGIFIDCSFTLLDGVLG